MEGDRERTHSGGIAESVDGALGRTSHPKVVVDFDCFRVELVGQELDQAFREWLHCCTFDQGSGHLYRSQGKTESGRHVPIPVDQRTKPAGISIACGLAFLLRVSLMVIVTFSGETTWTLHGMSV